MMQQKDHESISVMSSLEALKKEAKTEKKTLENRKKSLLSIAPITMSLRLGSRVKGQDHRIGVKLNKSI